VTALLAIGSGGVIAIVTGLALVLLLVAVALSYRKCEPGQAIVRTGLGRTKASLSGLVVLPGVQRHKQIDITEKKIEIRRRGDSALTCRDGKPIELIAMFYLRVAPDAASIERAVAGVGAAGVENEERVAAEFQPRLEQALEETAAESTGQDIYDQREEFKRRVKSRVGDDLGGFELHDVALDHMEIPEM